MNSGRKLTLNDLCDLWRVIGATPFPLHRVTSHPLDCVLDGRHREVWQRTLVAVEQRLPAREDTHQCLA